MDFLISFLAIGTMSVVAVGAYLNARQTEKMRTSRTTRSRTVAAE